MDRDPFSYIYLSTFRYHRKMGLTHVEATMRNLGGDGKPYRGKFLVDTGAIHCVAPREDLLRAGVEIEGTRTYELADGSRIDHDFGFTRIELMGLETVCHVVFGPNGVDPIIGVSVLENLGLAVDPASESLVLNVDSPLKAMVLPAA